MRNVLVAGMTNAGKTILARELMARHGYSRVPGDSLVLALGEAFPEIGIAHDREVYEETCRHFTPFVVRLIRALAWESRAPYVVDTFHVWPSNLAPHRQEINFDVLFLGYPEADPAARTAAVLAYARMHGGWARECSAAEARARIELFIRLSVALRDECAMWGFPFVDTSDGFAEAIERAITLVTHT